MRVSILLTLFSLSLPEEILCSWLLWMHVAILIQLLYEKLNETNWSLEYWSHWGKNSSTAGFTHTYTHGHHWFHRQWLDPSVHPQKVAVAAYSIAYATHLLMGHNFNPVLLYWSLFFSFVCTCLGHLFSAEYWNGRLVQVSKWKKKRERERKKEKEKEKHCEALVRALCILGSNDPIN